MKRSSSTLRSIGEDGSSVSAEFPGCGGVLKVDRRWLTDGTILRLPENSSNLVATCPVCRYSFAYNTSPLSFIGQSISSMGNKQKSTQWWKKLWPKMGAFGRWRESA